LHELEYPSLGPCSSSSSSNISSNSSSRAASISTSVDISTSLSTVSSTASSTTQQTRRSGRHGRFVSAKNSPQAAAIQRALAEGAHKHHESPQQVAAKRWQALQLQRGIVQTRIVIGASEVGKCAGLSSHRYAQTEALESLLKKHNPARYIAAFNKHSCISDEERAQLIIQKAPQLQVPSAAVQQLGAFEDMANSHHIRHLVHAQMAAALAETAEQAAVNNRDQAAEAAHKDHELRIASAAAAAARCVLDAFLLQFETVTAQTEAQTAAQPEAQTAAQTEAQPEAQIEAHPEAQTEARSDSASLTDAVAEAQTDNATTATSGKLASEHSHTSDTALSSTPSVDDSMSAVEQLVSTASDLSDAEYLADCEQSSCSASQPDSSGSEVSEPLPAITEDDIKFLHQITNKKCNTAYGMHAERPTARELNNEAAAQFVKQLWFKMGARDNRPLGSFGGVAFELGCQIDGALLQGGSAVPTEIKNRTTQFPRHLPKHELVQVQCQLQLSEATKGLLIERLDHGNGWVEMEQHTIHRDDVWWDAEIMPALQAFLKVFASIAVGETQLDSYLIARKDKRHESYLKHLVRQQLH